MFQNNEYTLRPVLHEDPIVSDFRETIQRVSQAFHKLVGKDTNILAKLYFSNSSRKERQTRSSFICSHEIRLIHDLNNSFLHKKAGNTCCIPV